MLLISGHNDSVALYEANSIRGPGWDLALKTDAEENTQRLAAEEIINHPLFTKAYDYDYALIKLSKRLNLADVDVTPICLPPATTYDSFGLDGIKLTVAGWGLADEKAKASTRLLQKLDISYIPYETCKGEMYTKSMTRRMFCAGHLEGERDACSGDSGGPLVHQVASKQFWQMGVVSWGKLREDFFI